MEKRGFDRREFLRRAGMTGAAVAWATPLVQTVAATPAFAQELGTPAGGCFHSNDDDPTQSCMDACTSTGCTGDACNGFGNPDGPCAFLCHERPGNSCCNAGLCNPDNFRCDAGSAVYTGSLVGCD